MKEIFNFVKKVFSSSSDGSCKRITGFIILMSELVSVNCRTNINPSMETLHITLIYCGAGLIGLGVLESFKKL